MCRGLWAGLGGLGGRRGDVKIGLGKNLMLQSFCSGVRSAILGG